MLRASLIAAAFLAVTIALVLMQPGKPRRMAAPEMPLTEEVTRSGPDLAEVGTPLGKPTDPLVQSMQAAVDAGVSAQAPRPEQAAPKAASGLDHHAFETTCGFRGGLFGAWGQGQSESYIDAL